MIICAASASAFGYGLLNFGNNYPYSGGYGGYGGYGGGYPNGGEKSII